MAFKTHCDVCGRAEEGMLPHGWLIFSTKYNSTSRLREHDIARVALKKYQ